MLFLVLFFQNYRFILYANCQNDTSATLGRPEQTHIQKGLDQSLTNYMVFSSSWRLDDDGLLALVLLSACCMTPPISMKTNIIRGLLS